MPDAPNGDVTRLRESQTDLNLLWANVPDDTCTFSVLTTSVKGRRESEKE